ncbi:MAG: DUF6876 family protein [Candidatus Omnitrophota bacterium]
MSKKDISKSDLTQFTGTTQYFKHWTRGIVYTDGVQFLAEHAGAYWLIDLVASYQPLNEGRQYWALKIEDGQYCAECRDRDNKVLVRQVIEFSDFPENLLPFTCYLQDGVMFLPSED